MEFSKKQDTSPNRLLTKEEIQSLFDMNKKIRASSQEMNKTKEYQDWILDMKRKLQECTKNRK